MRWFVMGLALLGAGPFASAEAQRSAGREVPPPGARYAGRAFRFDTVAPGVWFATATGAVSAESNSAVIELGDALLVVDAQTSPAAAWALLREIPRVSRKPVRYLVVTHVHYDHAHGTQSFPPGVTVIGTPYTRAMIAAGKSVEHPTALGNRNFAAAQIATLTQALDTAATPAGRAALTAQRAVWENYLRSLATLTPIPPDVTVSGRMSIIRGGREVQVIFPGKAHTDGDLVVWLPTERVLVTGDLLQPTLPYMGDGYLDQWADVLDSLRALAPAVVLPGHGGAFRDLAVLERQRDYFRAVWRQLADAKGRGLTAEQAAAALDLRAFDAFYPRPPGWTDAIALRQRMRMVHRVYALLDGVAGAP
jgi:cyclase